MKLNYRIIACIDSNNGIGLNNSIPWYEPQDLKIFQTLTNKSNVVMGRKTYQSIIEKLGKPLPNRTSIVLTKNKFKLQKDVIFCDDKEDVLNKYPIAWIIGGANIYKQFIPYANKMYLSVLHKNYNCDTFFPKIPSSFKITSFEKRDNFNFLILTKNKTF